MKTIDLTSVPTEQLLQEIQDRCGVVTVVPIWADSTLKLVAEKLKMPLSDLINIRSRTPSAHWPRSIAIAALRSRKDRSWQSIAKIWNLNHATAIHANRRVEKRMKLDPAFAESMKDLLA